MAPETGSSRRSAMYGENDLSSLPLFSGHYINFGYWYHFTPGIITIDERTDSQANLYRTVLRRLTVDPDDVVLEVGCGIAVGTALTLREFNPSAVHGLDESQHQLDRAALINAGLLAQEPRRLVLRRGSALDLPYASERFDKCYSVEAAQHFEDLATFAAEACRVLKPGGRLVITTFFMPHQAAEDELRTLIATIDNGIDVVFPIDTFRDDLRRAGFERVSVESIGDHVWHGLDAWTAQTELRDGWGRNWLKAYQRHLIDYYLITADKS